MSAHVKLFQILATATYFLRPVNAEGVELHPSSFREPFASNWEDTARHALGLFANCKVQIIVSTLQESDEMLQLAEFFGNQPNSSALLVHPIYHENGNGSEILFPKHYEPSSFRKDLAERWRHTRCYVQLYSADVLRRHSRVFLESTLLTRLPHLLMGTRDNPSYLLVLLENDEFEDESIYMEALPSLIQPAISSTYVVIRNGKFIDIICISCFQENGYPRSSLVKPYVTAYKVAELEDLRKMWQKTNENLLLGPVLWYGQRSKTQCHPLKDKLLLPPKDCAMLIITKKLNFTAISIIKYKQLIAQNRSQFMLGMTYTNGYSDPSLFRSILQHLNYHGFDWSVLGSVTENFRTIAVMDVHEMNISAFWRALDLPAWICTFVAAFLITVTFVALAMHKLTVNSILRGFGIVLGFLIDHSLLPNRKQYVVYIPAAVLLFLWAQMAMMISSGYRGALFSLLTSTSTPVIPNGMEELAACEDLVLTNAAYYNKGKAHSLLHATVQEFREETQNTRMTSVRRVRKNARLFGKKLVFVNSSVSDILYSQTREGADYELQRGDDKSPIHLPSSYVMVGKKSFSSTFSLLMNVIWKKLMIVKGDEIPLMMQHVPLLVYRNFFAYQFTRVLHGIVESGMWERWERYYTLLDYKWNRDSLSAKLKGNGTKKVGLPNRNIMAALFLDSEAAMRANARRQSAPLPLTVLQSIFLMYFVMLCISFVHFLWERFKPRRYRTDFVFNFVS